MNFRSRAVAIDSQRIAARAVFGALMALLLVLVMLPLGTSMAQSPTTINIVNPHPNTSTVLSDKERPVHLNSWVNTVPANPLVEYQLATSTTTINIGQATQAGDHAFELLWNIPDTISDGSYTLRAILYTGFTGTGTGTEVARDEMPVRVNQSEGPLPPGVPDPDDPAETVELTYPQNGSTLGVYVTPAGAGSFIIEADVSSGTRFIRGFYSVTPYGAEPEFKPCGAFRSVTPDPASTSDAKFQCNVAAADFPLDITAVAVSTNDTPPPAGATQTQTQFNDAADAHVVEAYFQRVQSFTLSPEAVGNVTLGRCQSFTAAVTDQTGREIAGMNVDAHAFGPDDNVDFDTGTNFSNASKAPDQNHTDSDQAYVCNSAGDGGSAGGTQGEHRVTGETRDRKHIESVNGTDVNGTYRFAVRSASDGVTDVFAWADADDDDLFCSQEASDSASIGWGTAAAGTPPNEPADVATCQIAEPSPSPSPTPTATATATSSPSPTATATGSPSPTPTTTASPSPDPTPDPENGNRQFSKFRAFKKAVNKGNFVRFKAVLDAQDHASCADGVTVKLKSKAKGKPFRNIKTKVTNTEGKVGFRVKVQKTKIYRVVAPVEGFCEKAVSENKRVRRK